MTVQMPVVGQPWEVCGPNAFGGDPHAEWRTVIVEETSNSSRFVAGGEVYWVGHSNNRPPAIVAGQLDLFGDAAR